MTGLQFILAIVAIFALFLVAIWLLVRPVHAVLTREASDDGAANCDRFKEVR